MWLCKMWLCYSVSLALALSPRSSLRADSWQGQPGLDCKHTDSSSPLEYIQFNYYTTQHNTVQLFDKIVRLNISSIH